MAADANLIKGAAAAYGAGTAAKQAGIAQIGQIADGLTARVDKRTMGLALKTAQAKERKREIDDKFYENQEAALLQGGALGTAEFDLTQKKVNGLKKQYNRCKLGDEACQRKVMMQLSQESQALTTMKDTRKLNAEAMKTLRGDVTQNEKHIMGIYSNSMSGDYTIDEDVHGDKTYTFKMPDGSDLEMSDKEVQRLFEKQQDAVGSEATKKEALAEIERGKNGEPFDEFKTGAMFDKLMESDNSLISALNDNWGVGNFSASIDNKIENDLANFQSNPDIQGLDIPVGDGEANWYENITKEDVALIKQRLMNPQSDEEKAISRKVGKEYYVDAMRQQNERGVEQAKKSSASANAKMLNENEQNRLNRESREKIARNKEAGLNARDPQSLKNQVFNKTVLPSFNTLKNEMYDPNVGDGKSKKIDGPKMVEKTLSWLEANVKDMDRIVHRTRDEIKEEYPYAIPGNTEGDIGDGFPEGGGYYEVVNRTDFRKNLPNGETNPMYGQTVQKVELIQAGNELTDINKIRNLLDLGGGLQNEQTGKYNN